MHRYDHIALQLILSSSEVFVCRSSRKVDAAGRALTLTRPIWWAVSLGVVLALNAFIHPTTIKQ